MPPMSTSWSSFPLRFVLSLSLAVAAATGCSTQAGREAAADAAAAAAMPAPTESGFLTSYAKLAPSAQSPALRMYRDESVRGSFDKVLFHSVQVWRSAEKKLEDVPESDLQFLSDAMYRAIRDALQNDFQLVDQPGPGVLEINLALTLVTSPDGKVDFFQTDVPLPEILTRSAKMNEATIAFVRDCAVEAEFAEQGTEKGKGGKPKRVVKAAFYDTRRGSESPKGNVKSWEDLDKVFQGWATELDGQLTALKKGGFQPKFVPAAPDTTVAPR